MLAQEAMGPEVIFIRIPMVYQGNIQGITERQHVWSNSYNGTLIGSISRLPCHRYRSLPLTVSLVKFQRELRDVVRGENEEFV